MEKVEATLAATHLRWLGHAFRIDDSRIPKMVLYGGLGEGKRKRGGQRLRYKDVAKRHIKAMNMITMSWEDLAADRGKWHSRL